MSTLILMRHGDALREAARDALRPLSVAGRRECASAAETLRNRNVIPGLIVASSCVRALQSAEIVAAALFYDGVIAAYDVFCPDEPVSSASEIIEALLYQNDVVLVACHEPIVRKLAAHYGLARGPFQTAEMAVINVP